MLSMASEYGTMLYLEVDIDEKEIHRKDLQHSLVGLPSLRV